MTWKIISNPLIPWGNTLQKIMYRMPMQPLDGKLIYIATDASGAQKTSQYDVLTAVYCDFQHSQRWHLIQRAFRKQLLPDGRRMSFKGLNDRHKFSALIPFLKAANEIHGVCISLIINKKVKSMVGGRSFIEGFPSQGELIGRWTPDLLEHMLRAAHLVSLLVGGLAKPHQEICWVSDEDAMFDTPERQQDVVKILTAFVSSYLGQQPMGTLGLATVKIDEGDRIEEDLAAISDLVAGALTEVATSLSKSIGSHIPSGMAVPFNREFTKKTELISSWIWEEGYPLKRIVLLAEDRGEQYAVSRLTRER